MKTILSIGSEYKNFELDRPAANGRYSILRLFQATFFDPATLESAQAMANLVQSRVSGELKKVRRKELELYTFNVCELSKACRKLENPPCENIWSERKYLANPKSTVNRHTPK